jgi:pimeloyl-ACP methyl ester carboxylesterase
MRIVSLTLLMCCASPVVRATDSDAPAPSPSVAATPAVKTIELAPPAKIPEPARFRDYFQPFRTENAVLSADGKYLAYSVREDGKLYVLVCAVDRPEVHTAKVLVADDETSTPPLAEHQRERTPARIDWMQWVTPTRLVVGTNRVHATRTGDEDWQTVRGYVLGFDADGSHARVLLKPDDVAESIAAPAALSPFAVSRNDGAFESRINSPDRTPLGATSRASRVSDLPPSASQPSADTPPAAQFASRPRSLEIFDLDPQRPGAVLVNVFGLPREGGTRSIAQFSLDATTGKFTQLAFGTSAVDRAVLLDRQGRIRVELSQSALAAPPYRYLYCGEKGTARPRPLDELTPRGSPPAFAVSPENVFGERSFPLGFDADPNLLYFASNVGRDTFGVYSLDLATGKRGAVTLENKAYDLVAFPAAGFPDASALVFDRYDHRLAGLRYEQTTRSAAWIRPDLREIQASLEKQFPGRTIEVLDWDADHRRYIVTLSGPADAGAFYLFDREQNRLHEFARRAPWLDAEHAFATLPFSYPAAGESRVVGLITVPRQARLDPVPLVIVCPDEPWTRVTSDFNPEVLALADMGFAVAQLSGRGAWGFGRRQRAALAPGYDLVQVEDIAGAVEQLEKLFRVNRDHVALVGRDHGGFIALRTLQSHPERFRSAIAIDAPVDLGGWLKEQHWSSDDLGHQLTRRWLGDDARLAAAPLTSAPEKIARPVLFLNYPGPEGQPRTAAYLATRYFADAVRHRGQDAQFEELPLDYERGLPTARADAFARIEAFLNATIYRFSVKPQEAKPAD